MKKKINFLSLKFIFCYLVLLISGIVCLVLFTGGLKPYSLSIRNTKTDLSAFIDFSSYNDMGIFQGTNPHPLVGNQLTKMKMIASNDNYALIFDEMTTIITVIDKSSYIGGEFPSMIVFNSLSESIKETILSGITVFQKTGAPLSRTAVGSSPANNKDQETYSNLEITYFTSKGTTNTLNVYDYSIQYLNDLFGYTERHYKVNYSIENGIEVLYEVGKFLLIENLLPKYWDRESFLDLYRGNMLYYTRYSSQVGTNIKEDQVEIKNGVVYQKLLYLRNLPLEIYDDECAAYLIGKFDVEQVAGGDENYNPNYNDSMGLIYHTATINNRSQNPNSTETFQYYKFYGFATDDYYPLLKVGVDFNTPNGYDFDDGIKYVGNAVVNGVYQPVNDGSSPCHMNQYSSISNVFNRLNGANGTGAGFYVLESAFTTDESSVFYERSNALRAQGFIAFNANHRAVFSNTPNSFSYVNGRSGANNIEKYDIMYYNPDIPSYFQSPFIPFPNLGFDYERSVQYRGNPYELGGIPMRDLDGNYVYEVDDHGEYIVNEYGELVPVRTSLDDMLPIIQNEIHNIVSDSSPPVFQIIMRFILTEDGMDVTILNDYLKEGNGKDKNGRFIPDKIGKDPETGKDILSYTYAHEAKIASLNILPYYCANDGVHYSTLPNNVLKGQIVLPDGSGAVMSFNSPKTIMGLGTPTVPLYGQDRAHILSIAADNTMDYMLGMFAFLDTYKNIGVLAIADKSAAQNSIAADYYRPSATSAILYNYAYYVAKYRDSVEVTVASYSYNRFTKITKDKSQSDMSYKYKFLKLDDFLNEDNTYRYDVIAQKYRSFLMERNNIEEKDDTKETVVSLNFLGAIKVRDIMIAFSYDKTVSLTTFEQAKNIIEDLENNGVQQMAVAYTSWTKDTTQLNVRSNVKVSSTLGSNKDFIEFNNYLATKGIDFYPEISITTAHGYNYSLGNQNYTARQISGRYAVQGFFNMATSTSTADMGRVNFVSPRFYDAVCNAFMTTFKKTGIKGGLMIDLGNNKTGDYRRNKEIFPSDAINYQLEAFENLSQNLDKIAVNRPYNYAFGYVNLAYDVPVESTLYPHYDYSIPLYQLVVSGLFDYFAPTINALSNSNRSDQWYLLKCIETGSNLAFQLSHQNTNIFIQQDTDARLTQYSKAFYLNYRDKIIEMNNTLNDIGIHQSRLVNYKLLADNVCQVTYANGLSIVINYNDTIYRNVLLGVTVRGNSYAIVEVPHA